MLAATERYFMFETWPAVGLILGTLLRWATPVFAPVGKGCVEVVLDG